MLSTTEANRHTPDWLKKNGDAAPVYLLRRGSVIERASLEAELAGEYQAGRVFAVELLAAFRAGIAALLPDDPEGQRLIELANAESDGEQLPADEAKVLDDARAEVGRYFPPYRAIKAQEARRRELAPVLAFRRFCIGWENLTVPAPTADEPDRREPLAFKRGIDGLVPLAITARIDPIELLSAGNEAFNLLYAGDLEGN